MMLTINQISSGVLTFFLLFTVSCKKRDDDSKSARLVHKGTPFPFEIPAGFPNNSNLMPEDNPMTVEGVALGRRLFYEKRLSGDNSMSCASCHNQQLSFTDGGTRFSTGIDGIEGNRNAMPIINLAWSKSFFWDGRRLSLEKQAHDPVVDPIEMHDTWPSVVSKLNSDASYKKMFLAAFGKNEIDSLDAMKAIAQFERSMISSNSKFDRFLAGKAQLTPQELMGKDLFMRDREVIRDSDGKIVQIIPGADCFHCHMGTGNPLLTDDDFHNNGLDVQPQDSGLARVTQNPADFGKFKTPTLRNLAFTAPYMHDGRFQTLDEVINFYSEGLQPSATIDPLMKNVNEGGINLSPMEKQALKAFLLTFTDSTFINNTSFQDPALD
jgi:cytochrome c peroxidase